MKKNYFLKKILLKTFKLSLLGSVIFLNTNSFAKNEFDRFLKLKGEKTEFPLKEDLISKNNNIISYINKYKDNLINRIELNNNSFIKGKDWLLLKKVGDYKNKNEELKGNITVFFDYSCKECVKLQKALKIFERQKENNMEFANMESSFIPIVLSEEHPYSLNLLKKSNIFFALEEMLSKEDFYKINELLFIDLDNGSLNLEKEEEIKKWIEDKKIDYNKFSQKINEPIIFAKSYFAKKRLEKQTIADSPMVIINGKFFIPSTTIKNFNEYKLVELIEYLSSIAMLDKVKLLSLEQN